MPCRLEIQNLRVRSLSTAFQEVHWDLESTREDVLDYTFQVLRSEGSAGPWDVLSPEMEDTFFFVDANVNVTNRWRIYHYLLRVKHKPSGDTRDFGPVVQEAEPDLIAVEVRKHIVLMMKETVGRRCWVLQRRTFGQRCVNCYDFTLKQKKKSGCLTCFDTGFVRGYYSPIETYIQFDPSTKRDHHTQLGKLQQKDTTARCGYFPELKPDDLIIEPENKRWRVTQQNNTERLRARLHQEIQVHEIPRSDIEYKLEIDLGVGTMKTSRGEVVQPLRLEDITFASERNFTNPQNLESVERDPFNDVYSLYKVK